MSCPCAAPSCTWPGSFYCLGIRGECPGCHQVTELVETPSMTAYADDSLNRPFWACSECSGEYVQMMQEQWAGYWSGLL